jgi:hypothetical protein
VNEAGEVARGARGRLFANRIESLEASTLGVVSTDPANSSNLEHLELSVEELLNRARPLPPHDEMVIEDLSEAEGAAFLAAIDS